MHGYVKSKLWVWNSFINYILGFSSFFGLYDYSVTPIELKVHAPLFEENVRPLKGPIKQPNINLKMEQLSVKMVGAKYKSIYAFASSEYFTN